MCTVHGGENMFTLRYQLSSKLLLFLLVLDMYTHTYKLYGGVTWDCGCCWSDTLSIGMNSPQSLKKILSLSEEATERHRKQTEDAVSSTSSPPTSPRSSPKKGKDSLSILTHTHTHTHSQKSLRIILMSHYRVLANIWMNSMADQFWFKYCTL